jgi:hypothetical protein
MGLFHTPALQGWLALVFCIPRDEPVIYFVRMSWHFPSVQKNGHRFRLSPLETSVLWPQRQHSYDETQAWIIVMFPAKLST